MIPRLLSLFVLVVAILPALAFATPPAYKHGEKASVLIFTTTDCPVANAMLPEIARIARDFSSKGAAFTLVYVDPDTTEARAREHAKTYGISIPYVLDPRHELVKRCEAERTPEACVILPDEGVAYRGRINDLFYAPGQRRRSPTTHDLREALAAVISGREVANAHQPAVGCVIADFAR
jgi:hypothetical protein